LLVVSKALTASFKNSDLKDFLVKVNFTTNNCDLNDGCENFANIVYKMQSDPEVAKEVYSLYAGPNNNFKIFLMSINIFIIWL